jgi:uncharacterized damage-inducible protein DinB
MSIRHIVLGALLVALPSSALAQSGNPITAGAKAQFDAVSGFVVRAAEKVPEDAYEFRATAEVRTMGQLFGHVADGLFGMCATAGGGKPPRTGIEKSVTGKANLVAALKEGVAYCQTVYTSMTDQKGLETVPFYFGPSPRSSVLYFNVAHAYEHYGNLVTYMRLKNIVPPSSEPAAKPGQ